MRGFLQKLNKMTQFKRHFYFSLSRHKSRHAISSSNQRIPLSFLNGVLLIATLVWASSSFQTTLAITSPPTFTRQPPYELIYDSRILVTLECLAEGEPEPTYYWKKNSLKYDPSANDGRVIMVPGKGTLTITRPIYDDEGLYQCFATNQFGTAVSNAVRLQHARLESFPHMPQPSVMTVNNGDPLTLNCLPPKGIPPPLVFWLISDEFKEVKCSARVMQDMDGNLNFAYVNASEDIQLFARDELSHNNPFTCVANNPTLNTLNQGEFQIIKVLNPGDPIPKRPPERMWTSSVNSLALRSQNLVLRCIYSGFPSPKITWRRIDGDLPIGRHTFECFSHDLIIENIQYSDAGDYECRAANGIGQDQKRVMRVQVQSAPYWTVKPEDANAAEDETYVIKCQADGVPKPQIQWFFNGRPITESAYNERRKVEGDSITIVDLKKDADIGVYQCNASNTHGYIFANSFLNILAEPPVFKLPPKSLLEVVDLASANLTCVTFGAPAPQITWYKDGIEITGGRYSQDDSFPSSLDSTGNKGVPSINGLGSLVIEKVTHSDAGNYTCTARNKFGSETASGMLVVKSHTIIQSQPQNGEVRIGEPVVFRCSAVQDPSLDLIIDWEKNGESIFSTELPKNSIDYNHIRYNNFPNGEYGDESIFKKGQTPDLDIDNQRVFKSPIDNSLTITNAQQTDTASYTCVARTRLDRATATANLTVQDVPNPPTDVTLLSCMSRSATVSWRPGGDNSAPILRFIIQYNSTSPNPSSSDKKSQNNELDNGWTTFPEHVPPGERQYTLQLKPYVNYTFRVLAENKIGLSPVSTNPSNSATSSDIAPFVTKKPCSTPPDVPEANPTGVKAGGGYPDRLDIFWTPLPKIDRGGPGFHYLVKYRQLDPLTKLPITSPSYTNSLDSNGFNTFSVMDAEQGSLTINKQPTYTPYEISVTSVNDLGQAKVPLVPVIGYSGEDVPISGVPDFRLIDINGPDSARLAWGKVNGRTLNGEFKGFKILTWTPQEGLEKARETIISDPNQNTIVVKTFKPFSTNMAAIRVFNNYYDGPMSQEIRLQTPEGIPEMVENFRAYALGSNALQLRWEAPSEPNGILTGYHISYSKVINTGISPAQELPAITDPKTLEAKIPGLETDTKYRVEIAATTQAGMGKPDLREVKTSRSGRPLAPSFSVNRIEGKRVNVTWTPAVGDVGSDGTPIGNPGSLFYVQYRVKGDDLWQRSDDQFLKYWDVLENLQPGTVYQMRVVAQNDLHLTPSDVQEVRTPTTREESIATAGWFVGLMCALAILLLIMIIICLVRRNRGGKYPVHEKERAKGLDPDNPNESGFDEYNKDERTPFNQNRSDPDSKPGKMPGSRFRSGPEESESDSLAEYYADLETGKFDEDGSFIGQYGKGKNSNVTNGNIGKNENIAGGGREGTASLATFV
ncbi:neuroglian-like [Gordionus sp. m RMFG-2023]|uniref:neuroglian-like n=1 Tax=Gordionus sp. m RMFG-2023 TaxID=3053472 RepID=UPI0031FC1113